MLHWMTNTFPAELTTLQSQGHEPVDLQRVQNEALRSVLESSMHRIQYLEGKVDQLVTLMDRRTAQLSPSKQAPVGTRRGLLRMFVIFNPSFH